MHTEKADGPRYMHTLEGYDRIAAEVVGEIRRAIEADYGAIEPDEQHAMELLITSSLDWGRDYAKRSASLFALYHVGDARAVEALSNDLVDTRDHGWLRGYAAVVLARIHDPRSLGPMIQALQDPDPVMRWFTVGALAYFKDASAVEPLIQMLTRPENNTREVPGEVDLRANIALALGEIADRRAVEPLITLLSDSDDNVRTDAAAALAQIPDESAVTPLINCLQDSHTPLRAQAAKALGATHDKRAVGPLVTALEDAEAHVRAKAAEALGMIGDKKAVPALVKIQTHDDAVVRGQITMKDIADTAIRQIGK